MECGVRGEPCACWLVVLVVVLCCGCVWRVSLPCPGISRHTLDSGSSIAGSTPPTTERSVCGVPLGGTGGPTKDPGSTVPLQHAKPEEAARLAGRTRPPMVPPLALKSLHGS